MKWPDGAGKPADEFDKDRFRAVFDWWADLTGGQSRDDLLQKWRVGCERLFGHLDAPAEMGCHDLEEILSGVQLPFQPGGELSIGSSCPGDIVKVGTAPVVGHLPVGFFKFLVIDLDPGFDHCLFPFPEQPVVAIESIDCLQRGALFIMAVQRLPSDQGLGDDVVDEALLQNFVIDRLSFGVALAGLAGLLPDQVRQDPVTADPQLSQFENDGVPGLGWAVRGQGL